MKKKIRAGVIPTRRRWARHRPENTPSLKGIALTQGTVARVIDISCGGALIESDVRLCPHTKVGFKVLMEQGDFRMTGSVLRSCVKSLKDTPIYRSAVVFDTPLTVLVELEPDKPVAEATISNDSGVQENN